jgi:hypothetical protein
MAPRSKQSGKMRPAQTHKEEKGGSGTGQGRVPGGGAGEGSGRSATAERDGGGRRSSDATARAGWNRGERVWTGLEKGKWVGPNGIEEFLNYSKEFKKDVT